MFSFDTAFLVEIVAPLLLLSLAAASSIARARRTRRAQLEMQRELDHYSALANIAQEHP